MTGVAGDVAGVIAAADIAVVIVSHDTARAVDSADCAGVVAATYSAIARVFPNDAAGVGAASRGADTSGIKAPGDGAAVVTTYDAAYELTACD